MKFEQLSLDQAIERAQQESFSSNVSHLNTPPETTGEAIERIGNHADPHWVMHSGGFIRWYGMISKVVVCRARHVGRYVSDARTSTPIASLTVIVRRTNTISWTAFRSARRMFSTP